MSAWVADWQLTKVAIGYTDILCAGVGIKCCLYFHAFGFKYCVHKTLEGFTVMRYINLRFTYLVTYLFTAASDGIRQ